MNITFFCDMTSCSLAEVHHIHGMRPLTLKAEAALSSETSINFYQTIRRHIPGHSNVRRQSGQIFTQYRSTADAIRFIAFNDSECWD